MLSLAGAVGETGAPPATVNNGTRKGSASAMRLVRQRDDADAVGRAFAEVPPRQQKMLGVSRVVPADDRSSTVGDGEATGDGQDAGVLTAADSGVEPSGGDGVAGEDDVLAR